MIVWVREKALLDALKVAPPGRKKINARLNAEGRDSIAKRIGGVVKKKIPLKKHERGKKSLNLG